MRRRLRIVKVDLPAAAPASSTPSRRLEDRSPEPTRVTYLTEEAEGERAAPALGQFPCACTAAGRERRSRVRIGISVSAALTSVYIATSCKSSLCFLRAVSRSVRQAIARKLALLPACGTFQLRVVCEGGQSDYVPRVRRRLLRGVRQLLRCQETSVASCNQQRGACDVPQFCEQGGCKKGEEALRS